MNINFTCPGCGANYSVSRSNAGKKADCKRCGLRQNIPNPPPQSTILGEVIRPDKPAPSTILGEVIDPHEKSESNQTSSEAVPSLDLKTAEDSESPANTVGQYLPPLRNRSKTGQIAFFIIGGMTFFALGILVLVLIARRGEELKSPQIAKKDPKQAQKNTSAPAKNQETNPQPARPNIENESPKEHTPKNSEIEDATKATLGIIFIAVIILIIGVIYFLPTLIALIRGHANLLAVFMMNLLLGWIFIGWAIAMIWACWNKSAQIHKHYHYEK